MSYAGIIKSNDLFRPSRLRSLFLNFDRLKESNPDGYEANLLAWKSVITSIFQAQNSPVLDTSTLIDDLLVSADVGGTNILLRPLSIDTVLNELVNDLSDKKLVPLADYNSYTTSIYDNSLLGNLSLKKLLFWVLSKSGLYNSQFNATQNAQKIGNYVSPMRLVYIPKLEALGLRFVDLLKKKTKLEGVCVFTEPLLVELLLQKLGLSEEDAQLVIKFLLRDKNELLLQQGDIHTKEGEKIEVPVPIVKLKKSPDDIITSNDVAIAQLKDAIDSSSVKIGALHNKVTTYNKRIQTLVNEKANRDYIKLFLKTKKSLESSLVNATANLTNLESILSSIQLQKDNIEVVKLLSSSSSLLKELNNELDTGKVDLILEDISVEKSRVNEFNDTLAEFNDANKTIIDEDEIDQELTQLEEETQKEKLSGEALEQSLVERLERLKVKSPKKKEAPTSIEKVEGKKLILEGVDL